MSACPLLVLLVQLFSPGPQGVDAEVREILASAGAALEAGDLGAAESGFERADSLAPRSPLPPLGLCEVEARRRRLHDALEHCRESQRRAPQAPLPALRVAQLLAEAGHRSEAIEAFSVARALDPSQPSVWIVPALLLRDEGDPESAAALLQQGLPATPSPQLASELAFLHLALGRAQSAGRVAERALESWPDDAGLKLALGLALASAEERGDRDRAVALLQQALSQGTPDPGRVRLELGRLLLELDRAAEAVDELRRAARELPGEAEVHYRLGQALQLTGDSQGARQARDRFEALGRTGDDGATAGGVLGRLEQAQQLAIDGQVLSALDAVDALLAERPGVPAALALRARLLGSLGRSGEALEAAFPRPGSCSPPSRGRAGGTTSWSSGSAPPSPYATIPICVGRSPMRSRRSDGKKRPGPSARRRRSSTRPERPDRGRSWSGRAKNEKRAGPERPRPFASVAS